ncbi:MAG: iron chaperone [Candidatus Dormibacteria bacterium]
MTKHTHPVEEYLGALDEPKQSSLRQLRQSIFEVIPEAEECMSYGLPAFRLRGQVIAGFGAFKKHLSYFPYIGSVITEVGPDAAQYAATKGARRFPVDKTIPHFSRAQTHHRANRPSVP